MRATESSDAGAVRFGAGKTEAGKARSKTKTVKPVPFSQRIAISPITAAVALTSLLAVSLFTIHDTVRSFVDINREMALIGTNLATEIAALSPDAAQAAVIAAADRFDSVSSIDLIASGSASLQPTLLSQSVVAAPHGVLDLHPEAGGTLAGIVARAVGGLLIAGLITVLTWRRRKGGMPDMAQRQSYQAMASAIPMGVACWTSAGSLVVCNQQYRDRLNLVGNSVTYHDAVKRLITGGYMKLLNEDDTNRLLELHREDGSCLLIDERPLLDGGFMTLVSDVTERKKTDTLLTAIREEQRLLARRYHEEKLKAEAASRSKTNFLAHLSHDIRTPLNHIIGFAELMRHQTYGPLGDERYDDYVASIKQSGEHLLASFATIFDLVELESGQKSLRADPVPVDELLETVIQRFRPQATKQRLTFVRGEPCGAVVEGDRLGLTRMLANIVENSLRFTPAGGRVTLAAFAARDGVVLEVTDTGIGMDEERLASLSQPFALGDATFTREGVGPGLGISISRAIAELSGGHMAIDSSPSLGTTVAISLPLEAESSLQAAE